MFLLVETGGANRTTVDGRAVSDDADTLEKALKEAGFTIDDSGEIQGANVPSYFFIVKPDGTSEKIETSSGVLSSANLEKPILLGTKITSIRQPPAGKKLIEYKVQDLNGNTHTIPVEVADSVAKAKWSDIIKSAKDKGITIGNTPSGYTGNWKAGDTVLGNDTEIDPNQTIKPEFTKTLNYSVDKTGAGAQNTPITVPYPQTEATLKQIMGGNAPSLGNNSAGNPFTGWKVTLPDGTIKTVTSAQINSGSEGNETFPAGTKVEPTWYGDGGSYGGPERTLTNLSTGPDIGDGVTKDGKIIGKEIVSSQNADRILGYIYSVDKTSKTVKVVAKDVQPERNWSLLAQRPAYSTNFSSVIGTIDTGFDAWLKIVAFNSSAVYENYEAIFYAVCYPSTPQAIGYPLGSDNKTYNSIIDNVVNGDGYDNRWYLPAVKELEMIYEAGDELLNWTEDSHRGVGTTWISDKSFWSVNVSSSTATSAKYVDFTQNDDTDDEKPKTIEQNKHSIKHYILPVAEFKYKDDNVSH